MTNSLTRARRTPEQVMSIIEEIADRMASGDFQRGKTWKEYAEREGVSPTMARSWCASASRIAWAETDETRAELRADALARLERLAEKAEQGGRWRDAVAAISEAADIAGLKRGAGIAVQVNVGTQQEGASLLDQHMPGTSRAERIVAVREWIAALQNELAKLEAEEVGNG